MTTAFEKLMARSAVIAKTSVLIACIVGAGCASAPQGSRVPAAQPSCSSLFATPPVGEALGLEPLAASAALRSLPEFSWPEVEAWLRSLSEVSAAEEGITLPPGQLLNNEHFAYHDRRNKRAVKVTKAETLVNVGGVERYLLRLHTGNTVFDQGNEILGWVDWPGIGKQLISTQPWVYGRTAKVAEIDAYMLGLGFEKVYDGFFGRGTRGIWVGDVVPKNARVDSSGALHVVDFTMPRVSASKEEFYETILDSAERRRF